MQTAPKKPDRLNTSININNRYSFNLGGGRIEDGTGNTAYTAFRSLGHSMEEWQQLPADFWDLVEMDTREIHPKK